LVAGNGRIYVYEKVEDTKAPFRQVCEPLDVVPPDSKENSLSQNTGASLVRSMCVSFGNEDHIYFVSGANQLLKVDVPLYDGAEAKSKFEFIQCNFHSQEITGLDICIRKQLIVTCSRDRSVKIWNFVTKELELSTVLQEVAIAVAFHPSGFHCIVAVQDKIYLMNVLSKTLNPFKSIPIKHCQEVQFCNGGHLFAATQGNHAIQVYNFYTLESPPHYYHKGHVGFVKCIDWFDDDMGFASTGLNGEVYLWDFVNIKDGQNRIDEFTKRYVQMTSVANIPGRYCEAYCCGSDGNIWNIKDP
jgi:WD40 repeat protein